MLLIHNCRYTLLGARNVKNMPCRIDTLDINDVKDIGKAILREKHDIIVVRIQHIKKYNLTSIFMCLTKENPKTIILVLSEMRWPRSDTPLKLADNFFFVEERGVSELIRHYKKHALERYFADRTMISFTTTENKIIEMLSGEARNIEICSVLKIKNKTISSHISNIKRKLSARSYQQMIHAYAAKKSA